MKNNKILYLLVLFVLYVREWSIKPFGNFSNDFHFIVTMLYMMIGFFWYRKNSLLNFRRCGRKAYTLIIIGIVFSMIPAWIFHGQNFIQSIITYRPQMFWIIIPLLFKVGASEDEMIRLFKYGSCLIIAVFFLKLININLFVVDELVLERMKLGEHPNMVIGYWMLTIPIFWYLMLIKIKFEWKYLIPILICFVFVFLQENRSTLFPVTLMIVYVITFATKSKSKPFVVITFALVSLVVVFYTQDRWLSLVDETSYQMNDSDYARNVEISYFLSSEANPSILTYIFGNGFVSKHNNDFVEKLFELKIFNSDVGFIGFWNLYGILPVIVFLYTMFFALKKRYIPYYLKLWAIQMLLCSVTTSYFALPVHMMYYAMFFYLLYLNKYKQYE